MKLEYRAGIGNVKGRGRQNRNFAQIQWLTQLGNINVGNTGF